MTSYISFNKIEAKNLYQKPEIFPRFNCIESSGKTVEIALRKIEGVSVFFEGNSVDHNFPKKINRIEDVKRYLPNIWIKAVKNSLGEVKLYFNLKLLGGGILEENIPPEKLEEIKIKFKEDINFSSEDALAQLLDQEIIQIGEMENYEKPLEDLRQSIIKSQEILNKNPVIENEEFKEDINFGEKDQKYSLALVKQSIINEISNNKIKQIAQEDFNKKLVPQKEELTESNQIAKYSPISEVLSRVEENSLFITSANQHQETSMVLITGFGEKMVNLQKTVNHSLAEHKSISMSYCNILKNNADLQGFILKQVEDGKLDPVEASKKIKQIVQEQEGALVLNNKSKLAQSESMEQDIEKQCRIFEKLNLMAIESYGKTSKSLIIEMSNQVSTLRGKELEMFVEEQSKRQEIKEKEYKLDLEKRAKENDLTLEEKQFFLKTKEQETNIILEEKRKGYEIDLQYQLKIAQQEKERMAKEISYLDQKDGNIEQRNLMMEFKFQMEVYEKNVATCREEIALVSGKKNYMLNLKPPEIKTQPNGTKYVQAGSASYNIRH